MIVPLNSCLPLIDSNVSLECLNLANANFEAIKNVKSTRKFCLHIYGPIIDCKDELNLKISKLDNVNYLGVANPNNVQDLLFNYNLFINSKSCIFI